MFLFHVLSPTSSDLFLAFVRPFKAEDKIMRLFNAHQSSWLGHAMEPVLNNRLRGFSNQARRRGLQLDEPQSLLHIRKSRRFIAMRWPRSGSIIGNASSALRIYANKTIAKHLVLSARPAFLSERFAEIIAARPSILTPNAPLSGAGVRSTEASAPRAG